MRQWLLDIVVRDKTYKLEVLTFVMSINSVDSVMISQRYIYIYTYIYILCYYTQPVQSNLSENISNASQAH